MVVEDDDDLRETLCEALRDEGYATDGASDGRIALTKLRKHAFDLVLLDLMMPNMNGWELREAMLREDRLAEIPVVVMTAASRVDQEEVLAAAAYLRKPVALNTLLDTLAQVDGRT